MPVIDDLFEIYNYIRGQVTGDSIAVNQSANASTSVTPAFVDATSELATFTVSWADPKIRAVLGDPRRPGELSVRLRDPRGRLVPVHASFMHRVVGDGYVVFRIEEPAAGKWRIEVSTSARTHTRYTAAVFLRSPLRLVLRHPRRVALGKEIHFGAAMLDRREPFNSVRGAASVSAPRLGLAEWAKKFRRELDQVDPPKLAGGDVLPGDVARLIALGQGKEADALFARRALRVQLWPRRLKVEDAAPLPRGIKLDPEEPLAAGVVRDTEQQGSYNVAVTVTGTAPRTGLRFVRTDQISVLVG
jgi:hypothetical protein